MLNEDIDQFYKTINSVTEVQISPEVEGDICSKISDSNNFDSQPSTFNSSNIPTPLLSASTTPILNTAAIPKHHSDLYYNMKTSIQSLEDKLK